ncbi:hypothetical protein BKA67DRAFT_550578 [Truncatella angustata]|uniref:Cytoplasmic tRNA 2-thiolation protein 2 n=1 Tax=Truncatella angustata TaxID=152316 RepID=A0A9P8UXM2_9PEZI|nr:uncharacterized protein BKA67DRAFT_550578 [Truncatella angustata]KAH6661239.1 hypothetical protein BKA67DRAFT_550578 [Truncatella angustata]
MPSADAEPLLCIRCKTSPALHDLRQETVCSQCYKSYVSVKVVKRLELLQRETRLERGLPKTQRYLLALSPGGLSSTALLNILWENARQQRERKIKARFELLVAVVDTSLADASLSSSSSSPPPPPQGGDADASSARGAATDAVLDEYRARFEGVEFARVGLEDVLGAETIDWTALPAAAGAASLPPRQRLAALLAGLPSVSSRADVLRLLTRHVLVRTALREACDVLLLGYNTTSLAELTLAETAKGRGFAVPWGVNDGVATLPLRVQQQQSSPDDAAPRSVTMPIYHPLRELFRKEIQLYSTLTAPPLTPLLSPGPGSGRAGSAVVSHKDLSIDDVMARYFTEVEENYPSVVANVVRTTGKLNRSGNSEGGSCGLCGLGLDEAGDERWRGELGEQMDEGREARGRLCYGCERSVYG